MQAASFPARRDAWMESVGDPFACPITGKSTLVATSCIFAEAPKRLCPFGVA